MGLVLIQHEFVMYQIYIYFLSLNFSINQFFGYRGIFPIDSFDFFADITKEVIKDVAGQKIFYYTIREDLSSVHEIYEESPQKIFNPPVEIECMIEWQPSEVRTTNFGQEQIKTLTVYLHPRDLIDRDIDFKEGDYFSYGEFFFEATSIIFDKTLFLPVYTESNCIAFAFVYPTTP